MKYQLDIALSYPAVLGEGPVWDSRSQVLYWIDSVGNKAFRFDPATGENRAYPLPQNVGTLILTDRENRVLVGLSDSLSLLNLDTGGLEKLVDPEPDQPMNRLNDGKADARGRIWIGSMCAADNGVEGYGTRPQCALHRINRDLTCTAAVTDVRMSNGMAWSGDSKTFYYIDSPTQQVFAFDFDLEAGALSNRRVCIEVPQGFGVCDGMDIDVDGNLWIAHWNGWCVGKWDPRTGKLLGKIEMPVARVASCAFGGADYDRLYIVTAGINAEQDDKPQPEAGSVFVATGLGTGGLPFHRFSLSSLPQRN